MIDADKNKFLNIITANAEVYNKKFSTEALLIYWNDLKNFSITEIEKAFSKYRSDKKNKYMALPSDLLELLKEEKFSSTKMACVHTSYGNPCTNIIFIAKPYPMCEEHYNLSNQRSDYQIELDKHVSVYSDGAKKAGMSNYEFCKEILKGYDIENIEDNKKVKHFKDIMNTHNPLMEINHE